MILRHGRTVVGPLQAKKVSFSPALISAIRVAAAPSLAIPDHSEIRSSNKARCFSFMAEAFRPSGTIVLPSCPRTKHEIRDTVRQNRPAALGFVEGVQQSDSLVTLPTGRTHRFAAQGVKRGLGAGQGGCQEAALAGDRDVEGQMMAAELQHSWGFFGWRSQDRKEVEVFAEHRVVPFVGFEHLVRLHDLLNFFVAAFAERGRDECQRGGALRGIHLAQAASRAADEARWEVGPARALRFIIEREQRAPAFRRIECREKHIRGAHDARGRGLWPPHGCRYADKQCPAE